MADCRKNELKEFFDIVFYGLYKVNQGILICFKNNMNKDFI